jgi:hypothetical protein
MYGAIAKEEFWTSTSIYEVIREQARLDLRLRLLKESAVVDLVRYMYSDVIHHVLSQLVHFLKL